VVQPKAGAAGTWRLIGQTHADHGADHDTIVVQGPYDNFRKIKFKVTDAPLNMQRMVVTYDNGAPDNIDIRQNIPQGGESRVIDLRGVGKRSLRRIDFWYDTKGFLKGKADVTVFGMK
jgi:phosphoribosyl 1,2-cyclic phosphodiesterase